MPRGQAVEWRLQGFRVLRHLTLHAVRLVEAAARNFEQSLDRNPVPPAYLPAFCANALWRSRRLAECSRRR